MRLAVFERLARAYADLAPLEARSQEEERVVWAAYRALRRYAPDCPPPVPRRGWLDASEGAAARDGAAALAEAGASLDPPPPRREATGARPWRWRDPLPTIVALCEPGPHPLADEYVGRQFGPEGGRMPVVGSPGGRRAYPTTRHEEE